MAKNLMLSEAVPKMMENPGSGDLCRTGKYRCGFLVNKDGEFVTEDVGGGPYQFSVEHWEIKDWEIIPAKKEVITFEEWLGDVEISNHIDNLVRAGKKKGWIASAENKDLLYRPLVEICQNFVFGSETIVKSEIQEQLEKIDSILHLEKIPRGGV